MRARAALQGLLQGGGQDEDTLGGDSERYGARALWTPCALGRLSYPMSYAALLQAWPAYSEATRCFPSRNVATKGCWAFSLHSLAPLFQMRSAHPNLYAPVADVVLRVPDVASRRVPWLIVCPYAHV